MPPSEGNNHSAETEQTERIRQLNDQFRQTLQGGRLLVTQGVQALDGTVQTRMMTAIQQFDQFNADNDPHHEHDFGEVVIEGTRLWWKIDTYDRELLYGSPDPGDPAVTVRVMTVMLP